MITAKDVASIYEVPLMFAQEGVDHSSLKLPAPGRERARPQPWEELVDRVDNPQDEVTIGIVGKYVEYEDSYKSLNEALVHGALAHDLKVELPLGRGRGARRDRSVRALLERRRRHPRAGRLRQARHRGHDERASGTRARTKVPFFGICFGMQTACIEYARHVCGLADANSQRVRPATPARVIYKLRELRGVDDLGGTMRLGAWPCELEPGIAGARRPTGRTRSPSAIAIATSSTAPTRQR